METSTIIAIGALVLSAASTIWVGGFRFSALVHEVQSLKNDMHKFETRMEKRFDKLEIRMERLEIEFHKMDVRVSVLEKNKQ